MHFIESIVRSCVTRCQDTFNLLHMCVFSVHMISWRLADEKCSHAVHCCSCLPFMSFDSKITHLWNSASRLEEPLIGKRSYLDNFAVFTDPIDNNIVWASAGTMDFYWHAQAHASRFPHQTLYQCVSMISSTFCYQIKEIECLNAQIFSNH